MILLDFWAEWCHPCKMQAGVIDQLDSEYPDLKVIKVNIENDEEDLTSKFKVQSLPTIILLNDINDDTPVYRVSGFTPVDILKLNIDDAAKKSKSRAAEA